ncbi:MAG: alkaline phosphatase family protein [Verrucomicrobiaceae bacterium]|nr:MAG: alkaline phosphatase family protein [Verrucomicrobiaceae bacterium]
MTSFPADQDSRPGWNRFCTQLAANLRLILWAVLLLFISRSVLIIVNHQAMVDATAGQFIKAFFTGLRYDIRVGTIATAPAIILGILCLWFRLEKLTRRVRLALGYFVTISWVLIATITLGYFHEYHNQFDANILGVVYDDFGAVVQTIWKTYPVVQGILVLLVIAAVLCWIMQRWLRVEFPLPHLAKPRSWKGGLAVTLALMVGLFFGVRGTLLGRPMQEKDAGCTKDMVLNRCVVNPFDALNYAIKAHLELLNNDEGLDRYFKEEDLVPNLREFAGGRKVATVDEAFLRHAKGSTTDKPRHIFVVLLESYDGWTMLPQHESWGLAPNMTRLGKEGIYFPRFLAASRNTMTSLASVISGLGECGVITNERSRPGSPPYGTAIAGQMKALGYETHMFYAGLGTWQRIEEFSKIQGFEHTHMGPEMPKSEGSNEWGVTDRDLYNYIQKTIDPDKPSFSLILTASNHRPYSINLAKEGCQIKAPPPGYPLFKEGNATLSMLGHHLYSDKCVGEFVEQMSNKAPGSLFALTADHWGRGFPGPRPTKLEQALVPLVLWQKDRKFPDASHVSGSQYDLATTLIEMVAPKGHSYHSIGKDLFAPDATKEAISSLWVLTPDYVAATNGEGAVEALDGKHLSADPPGLDEQMRRFDMIHGISWYRIMRGNKLPE